MFDRKEELIDGKMFSVAPFGAMEALKIKTELIGIFGGSLGALISSGGVDLDSNFDASGAIESLLSKLTPDKMEQLVKKLFVRAYLVGDNGAIKNLNENDVFNEAFLGSLLTMYKVIWFVLKVNYPDFLGKIQSIGSVMETLTPKNIKTSVKTSSRKSVK